MTFCRDCGAKLEDGQVCDCKQQTSQQQESQQPEGQQPEGQQPKGQQQEGQQPVTQQPVNQQPVNQQPVNQQPVNQQPLYQQRPYQQPVMYNSNQSNLEEPMSVGEWLVTMLLMCIPCVNIVLALIWAFGSSEKKSKSNYFKAYLILILIVIAIYIVILIIFGAAIMAMVPKRGYTYY